MTLEVSLQWLAAMAKWTVQNSLVFLAISAYTYWKFNVARAPVLQLDAAPETSTSNLEPKKLAGAGAGEATPSTSLIIWATAILPVNVAAYYLTDVVWIATRDSELAMWPTTPLALFTLFPVLASLCVFMCTFVFPPGANPYVAEDAGFVLRIAMLDGVLLVPAAAVYAAYIYPERMIGQGSALAAAAAYASQSLVWAFFFHASQLSTARVIIGGSSRSAY